MICDGRAWSQWEAEGQRSTPADYMVIGGQAVLMYGEPRLTRDIDITLDAPIDVLPRVLKMVSRLGRWALQKSFNKVLKEEVSDGNA